MASSNGNNMPGPDLLDGVDLREKLEELIPLCRKKLVFISAYVTQRAAEWLCKIVPQKIEKHLICRLTPSDVRSGSTQISALQIALNNDFKIYCLHSLHAKIYSIDDETIYVGSANLTSNGLRIYGSGNLEACMQIDASKSNMAFIENIVQSSSELNIEVLQKMQNCIDLKETDTYMDKWPEVVLEEEQGIWVRDFFWSSPGEHSTSNDRDHDLEIMSIQSFAIEDDVLKQHLINTRCITWLINTLKQAPNQELYFGSLTKYLHEQIKDDPTPYRKEIKSLLQNMLKYCERYLADEIEITRPSYSQRVRLMNA